LKYTELVKKQFIKNVTKNKKEKCATVQRVGWWVRGEIYCRDSREERSGG
jgi:hypothetical protein